MTRIETNTHQVYMYRWIILAVFCSLEMSNALMWVTFAPISNIASNYFGNGYFGSTVSINLFANAFLILYLPGTVLSSVLMKKFKLRKTLIIGGILTVIACLMRYLAAVYSNSLGYAATYYLMLAGQSLSSIAQPIFLNMPPAVASIWFPVNERSLSSTIGAACSPIGNAIGNLIPVLLVKQSLKDNSTTEYEVTGMADLMLVEMILCIVPLLFAVIFLKDAPPTPPSHSTSLKIESAQLHTSHTQVNYSAVHTSDIHDSSFQLDVENKYCKAHKAQTNPFTQVYRECITLSRNKDYVLLTISFSTVYGFFCALMTLLFQIIEPYGYSNNDAGVLGFVFIIFGVVGSFVASFVMIHTKAYRSILKAIMVAGLVSVLFFIAMLFRDNYYPLFATFAVMGFCILPAVPVAMENCSECTYPIPEEFSMGILFVGVNLFGLLFVFVLEALLDMPKVGPFKPSNIFMCAIMLVALVVLQFYNGQYIRLQHECEHGESLIVRLSDDSSGATDNRHVVNEF